jgi:hypothetical protein
MSDKEHKKKLKPDDFFDYAENRLSEQERHDHERRLQQDPFDAEAAEGLEKVSREEASQDLREINGRLSRRIGRRRRIALYSAAAAVASLLIISTIFFTLETGTQREDRIERMSRAAEEQAESAQPDILPGEGQKQEEAEQSPGEGAKATESAPAENEPATQTAERTREKEGGAATPIGGKSQDKMEKEEVREKGPEPGIQKGAEDEPELPGMDDELQGAPEPISEPAYETQFEAAAREEAHLLQDMEQQSYPSAAARKSAAPVSSVRIEQTAGQPYEEATPVGGMDAFQTYLDSALVIPDTVIEDEPPVVELTFHLSEDGRPRDIVAIRSPGAAFSKEAIRVLREGPDWSHAALDGEAVDDELYLRIVFDRMK